LKKLNLDGNEIRDRGVRYLADALKNNIVRYFYTFICFIFRSFHIDTNNNRYYTQ